MAAFSQIALADDYVGNGSSDYAQWNSRNGMWTIKDGSTDRVYTIQWGGNGDITVPADYDGDGKTEIAVWRPSNGNWYISLGNRSWEVRGNDYRVVQWGASGDVPLPYDYDGDGVDEIAVYRPSNGTCYISTGNRSWSQKGQEYRINQLYRCGR